MTTNNDDSKVGYGKPPVHTRFKPGQSGNPRGRKKGVVDIKGILMHELNQKIRVREGDRDILITKQQALIKSRINFGINGNTAAFRDTLELIIRLFGLESPFKIMTIEDIIGSYNHQEQFCAPHFEDPDEGLEE